MPILEVTNLSKRFGGLVALDGIDLSVAAGERVGLIGPNGSGKSTLVNCICGTLINETGSVRFDGKDHWLRAARPGEPERRFEPLARNASHYLISREQLAALQEGS